MSLSQLDYRHSVAARWVTMVGWRRLHDDLIWNQRCAPEVAREYVPNRRMQTKRPDPFDSLKIFVLVPVELPAPIEAFAIIAIEVAGTAVNCRH